MKTCISIICVMVLMNSCVNTQFISSEKSNETSPLFPVMKNGDFGYINKYGKTIISPQFDYAADFFEGLARVKKNGKWSFMDISGEIVVRLAYPLVYDFQDSFALVQINTPLKFSDTKFGLINHQGELVIEALSNQYYNEENLSISPIYYFLLEKHQANIENNRKLKTIINKEKTIISNNNQILKKNSQHNVVHHIAIGLISGKFAEGLIAVKEGEYWGFMNKTQEWVIFPQFTNFEAPYFSEGLAAVLEPISNQYGYINKTGQWVIEPGFDKVKSFSEGLAAAKLGFKWGVLNQKGEIIIPFQFDDELFLFKKGLCKFRRLTKYNYINTKGEIVWEEELY